MDISFAFLATHAAVHSTTFSITGGGIERLTGQFPAVQTTPLFLAVQSEFAPEECGRELTLVVEIVGPDGASVLRVACPVTAPPPLRPGWTSRYTSVLRIVGLPIKSEGEYVFRLLVGGELKKTVRVYAEQQPLRRDL